MLALLFGILAAGGALAGGWAALYFRDRFHLVLGLSAGLLLGAAFFDLLPEGLGVGAGAGLGTQLLLGIVLAGFLSFYLMDHIFGLHPHQEGAEAHHHPGHVAFAGASGMGIHSLVDGIGIGVAFHTAGRLGLLVGIAVVGHRFSDGLNSVTLLRRRGRERVVIRRWVALISAAPIVGVAVSYFIALPHGVLGGLLCFFAGMFLYISTADLLPEAHHAHPTRLTVVATLVGVGALFVLTRLAQV